MSLSYQPTRQDMLDACRLHDLSVMLGRWRLGIATVYTAGEVMLLYAVLSSTHGRVAAGMLALASALAITGSMFALRYALIPPYLVRRVLKERRTPVGEWRLTLSEQGYAVQGDAVSSEVSWSHFLRWRENDRVILLYQTWQYYTFVPKRVLTAGEAQFIVERLRATGVPKARILLT